MFILIVTINYFLVSLNTSSSAASFFSELLGFSQVSPQLHLSLQASSSVTHLQIRDLQPDGLWPIGMGSSIPSTFSTRTTPVSRLFNFTPGFGVNFWACSSTASAVGERRSSVCPSLPLLVIAEIYEYLRSFPVQLGIAAIHRGIQPYTSRFYIGGFAFSSLKTARSSEKSSEFFIRAV